MCSSSRSIFTFFKKYCTLMVPGVQTSATWIGRKQDRQGDKVYKEGRTSTIACYSLAYVIIGCLFISLSGLLAKINNKRMASYWVFNVTNKQNVQLVNCYYFGYLALGMFSINWLPIYNYLCGIIQVIFLKHTIYLTLNKYSWLCNLKY